jgi:AcrR family transcriptional regulator
MSIDRKMQIISAAGECFAKYGYEKTSLDDIAKIVGINKASFYHYFKNKEEIFTTMITVEADLYISKTIEKANNEKDCKKRILCWIREGFSYLNSSSILNQLSYESLISLNPLIKGLVDYSKKKGTAYLAETLTYYIGKGELKRINVLKTAQIIQDIIYSLKEYLNKQNNYVQINEELRQKKIIEEIIESISMILDGIANVEENSK